jgi:hypothetical protein
MVIPGHKTISVFKQYNLVTLRFPWKEKLPEQGGWTPNEKRPRAETRNLSKRLVAGGGFEPPTFGL